MAGVGAMLRAIRGFAEGRKLDTQTASLMQITDEDVLSLVPEAFRPCASLRLQAARSRLSVDPAADIVLSAFEEVRKAGLERMMERYSEEPATRREIVEVVHSLDEYTRAAQADIASVDRLAKTLEQAVARQSELLDSLRQRVEVQGQALKPLSDLPGRLERAEARHSSARTALEAALRIQRRWLLAMSAALVLEAGVVIYLLTR